MFGLLSGFLAISGTLLAMFMLGVFHVTGLALHGIAIPSAMAAWGIAFLMTGLFEEFLCRGYLQYTLASGIGFWPAAFVMSFLFGFGHYFNTNETTMWAPSPRGCTGFSFASSCALFFCLWGFHRLSPRLELGSNFLRSSRQRYRCPTTTC